MVNVFEQTNLWKRNLANQNNDDTDAVAREKLRSSFLAFRERAALLVGEIHRDLPDYTVHDISHLDSLWEMADIIIGDGFHLTPTEVFILGGAILLHDAGMSLAAFPKGFDVLRKMEMWEDIIIKQYQKRFDRLPTPEEIENPNTEIRHRAVGLLLRNLHAQQAEKLAFTEWKADSGSSPHYLIEDNQIRQTFGRVIGQIAHSHWWSITQLETKFSRVIGAPHWCPDSWVVDPLKVACILRLADASHVDARRAPSFLRALRKLPVASDHHWKFQEKLQKPYLKEDALAYTSGYAFTLQDAEAWWLCLETLRMIDGELKQVDSLLAEKGLQRFAARRVAGIDNPERFASYVPTDGWHPVSAYIQVSDVPSLIKSLGGEELYGKDKKVSLRELIQNASDAIRARRLLENRPSTWGTIRICLGRDERGSWIEFQDNGIGMSQQVLIQYLLDFGKSYWGSDLMIEEFPGLLASGIKPAGKYGIGFFSTFMLGSAVKVSTRRYYSGQQETIVLEFGTGVSSRPIFRPAEKHEQIRDGGTCIRVWFDEFLEPHVFERTHTGKNIPINSIIKALCPAIDVNIELQLSDEEPIRLISSGEWINLDSLEFFHSISRWDYDDPPDYEKDGFEEFVKKAGENLRLITDDQNEVIGRACISVSDYSDSSKLPSLLGAVTVSGLYSCSLGGIAGILTGRVINTARDVAIPDVSSEAIAKWASEQAKLVPHLYEKPETQMECAQIIRLLGGNTENLPIGYYKGKWVSYLDIASEGVPKVEMM